MSLLGLVTIAAYGTWYYAFGVLLEFIINDTGWSEGTLTTGYAAGGLLGGLGAIPCGRLVDRVGARRGFAFAAVLAAVGFGVASTTESLAVYLTGSIIGSAALSGFAFYHITQSTAVRAAPDDTTRAISQLTIWGAFASAIYLPVAAFLVERFDWRVTLQVLAASAVLVLVVAIVVVRDNVEPKSTRPVAFRRALDTPDAQRFIGANFCIGLTTGVILVYQVPLMTDAGLPLATAAWFAGARGVAQVTGRIPVRRIVARFEARRSLQLAFIAIAIGMVLLTVSGSVAIAALYALIAGFGIGATSPLQGIYSNQLFDRAHLGGAMGAVSTAFGVAMAVGPAIAGVLADATGTRAWGIGIALVGAAGAIALLATTETTPATV